MYSSFWISWPAMRLDWIDHHITNPSILTKGPRQYRGPFVYQTYIRRLMNNGLIRRIAVRCSQTVADDQTIRAGRNGQGIAIFDLAGQ